MSFDVILADPPWSYRDRAMGKGVEGRYPTMSVEEICRLPVWELAAPDAILFLWSTPPLLPEALEVGQRWGFRYVTKAFSWWKTTKTGKEHVGMGTITRSNTEDVLAFRRGRSLERAARGVRQVVTAPVGAHSAKPVQVYERIEALYPEARRLEMFARGAPRSGWSRWGYDTRSDVALVPAHASLTAPLGRPTVAEDGR